MDKPEEIKTIFPILHLKTTTKLDLSDLDKYLKSKISSKAQTEVKNLFQRILKLRSDLDFKTVKFTLSEVPKLELLIKYVSTYASQVTLFDKYLSKDFENVKSTIKCNFEWSNSFIPNKLVKIYRSKYELVSIYYNTAILLINLAILIGTQESTSQKEIAREKIENSLWFLEKIKILSVNLSTTPQDLSLSFIECLICYCKAISYALYGEIEEISKDKSKNISLYTEFANISKTVSYWIGMAEKNLELEKMTRDCYSHFYNNLKALQIYHEIKAQHLMSIYHQKVSSNPNQEAIKIFLERAEKQFEKWNDSVKKDCPHILIDKILTQRNFTNLELKKLESNINQSRLMISTVKKQVSMHDVVRLEGDIIFVEPADMRIDESLENEFTVLLSDGLNNVKQEYETVLFEKSQNVIEIIRKFFAEKYKIYSEYKIAGMLSLRRKGNEKSKDSYFQSLLDIIKRFGGLTFFKFETRGLIDKKEYFTEKIGKLLAICIKAKQLEENSELKNVKADSFVLELDNFEKEMDYNKFVEDLGNKKNYDETATLLRGYLIDNISTCDVIYDESDYKLYEDMISEFQNLTTLDANLSKLGDQKVIMQDFNKEYEKLRIGDQDLINFFNELINVKGDHSQELNEKCKSLDLIKEKIEKQLTENRENLQMIKQIGALIQEKRNKNQDHAFKKIQAIMNTLRSLIELFEEIERHKNKFFEYSNLLNEFETELTGYLQLLESQKELSKNVNIDINPVLKAEKSDERKFSDFSLTESMISSKIIRNKNKKDSERDEFLLGLINNSEDAMLVSGMLSSRRIN